MHSSVFGMKNPIWLVAGSCLIIGLLSLSACASSQPSAELGSAGLICNTYSSVKELNQRDANGFPIWANQYFDRCAVGKVNWASAGGKAEGEKAAKNLALERLVSDIAAKDVQIIEESRMETSFRNSEVSSSGVTQATMKSKSETVTIRVKTLSVKEVGFTIFVLVERISPP